MADTVSFESLLNTTDGMTKLNTYVIQKNNTLEIEGVSWYLYAGKSVDKIYAHGGSLGFGEDTDHLKMFHGNTETNRLYSQKGTLTTGTEFLKLRVEGSYYYGTSAEYKFVYELFLFDDGNMYIYIIQRTQDKYNNLYGTCTITDGKTTKTVVSRSDTAPIDKTVSNIGINTTITAKRYVPIKEAGVRVKTAPATIYLPNSLDWSGLVIESYDVSENTNIVSNFTLPDGVDVSTAGTKTVNLTYKTYSIPVEILVKEDVVSKLTNIYLTDHYLLNESLKVTSIKAVWESGKTETLNEGFEVAGFDSTMPGTQELTFSYKGATATKSVYVAESATLTLNDNDSAKTQYYVGDAFEGVSCIITYDDGETEYTSDVNISGFDTTTAGEHIVTVSTRGLSTTYTINVSAIYSANIGSATDTDITAVLDLTTDILTLTGTGETKEIPVPSRDTGGIFDDGGYGKSTHIKKVIVSEGITGLIGGCFTNLSGITEITLPESLLTIGGDQCFYGCTGITELKLPQNLNIISNQAFAYCSNMELTILSRTVRIYEASNTLEVKKIRGYIGSTAETYAKKYNISFEMLDKITQIDIVSYPSRDYHIGENIDKTELTVKITLDDGTEQETDLYELSYDFSAIGAKTVTVTLGGQSASFTVNVVAYKLSELISNTNGMQVIRNSRNDDGTDTIDGASWFKFNGVIADKLYISGNNWIGFGTSTEQLKICRRDGAVWNIYRLETILDNGIKLLKIRVEGYTYYGGSGTHESQIKYELFLFDNGDMYLNMIQSPASTSSYAGTSSLICNGKTTTLSLNGAIAEKPVQISFLHQDDSGLDWDIAYRKYKFATLTGVKVIVLPEKIKYKVNETFDPSGIVVAAVYDESDFEEVTDYILSDPDMSSTGTKAITVDYQGKSTFFEITVIDVIKIEVTNQPSKTTYHLNETFITNGILISQVYTDGSKEEITDYTISSPDMSTVGDKKITVKYKKYSVVFKIIVLANTTGIRIGTYPDKFYYKIGEKLDVSGMIVMKISGDGSETEVTNYNVLGFNSSEAGNKTVRVAYTETTSNTESITFSTSFQIQVTKDGRNPFEDDTAEFTISVHWPDGEFEDLRHEDIEANSIVLQEGLCDASYFIYGGCLHNMISFSTHSEQFWGTEESCTPHGKIEVSITCNGTPEKLFTGIIDSGKRDTDAVTRKIIAYDELYKYRNADIIRWYKSKTTNNTPPQIWTQKQFRDNLFGYLGIKQGEANLYYDDARVPNNAADNEMNVVTILKDLCLQNSVFGWMDRNGEFQYIELPANSYLAGTDVKGNKHYDYYEAELHFDTYEKLTFTEGRIWHPYSFYTTPDPHYWFTDGGPGSAQEAYESNTYYNRNSFFVGDSDWLDYAWDADEYGVTDLEEPLFPICYGTTNKTDQQHLHRAQQYSITLPGNPMVRVGQTVEILNKQILENGQELTWKIHSYIMSRTLRILGNNCMEDTYSANNAPYNSNNQELGKYVPRISAEAFRNRSEMPKISYDAFSDGTSSDFSDRSVKSSSKRKLVQMRCMKVMPYTNYQDLSEEQIKDDTVFMTYEELE